MIETKGREEEREEEGEAGEEEGGRRKRLDYTSEEGGRKDREGKELFADILSVYVAPCDKYDHHGDHCVVFVVVLQT